MPLVQKHWASYGLTSWKVLKFNDDSPYCVQATLEFESMEAFQKAGASQEAGTVMGDIPNFCDKQPTILPGEVVGTS